ncbi:MAG: O-antigen ligase family protein [Bacteroidetes bacterium]|nr:O-antigen ligase family protein [Bacteroidota bacterium]
MHASLNPFDTETGSDKLRHPSYLLILGITILITGYLIAKQGVSVGISLIALPFIAVYLTILFRNPIVGLYTAVSLGFVLLGIPRYIKGLSVIGVAMDGVLIMTYLALIFNRFYQRINWKPANKDVTILAGLWFGYGILQFLNPEAHSKVAWLAGLRGMALYMMLIIPLALILVDNRKKLNFFLMLWGFFSLLVSLKGLQQLLLGVDQWEQQWLNEGAAATHVLFGKLRVFSFLSDAGNFGANQAFSAVVATIISFSQKSFGKKLFFIVVAVLGFYGMLLSGTRGAISVPLSAFLLYFILKKNKAVMITGFILIIGIFVFFKYTTIGNDNQQIRRMRSGFDPNDKSLQVRLANQKKLSAYLASRPLGGGIGHAGVKAQRYLPNAFLSNVATDSWYVMIWAEQGVVGLALHLFILFYIIAKSSYLIMFKLRDPEIKQIMTALTAGMFGIMVASYGNEVFGTHPTGILIYVSMALMLNAEQFDEPPTETAKKSDLLLSSNNIS